MTFMAAIRAPLLRRHADRGMTGPSTIVIASGSGYAGSVYRATDPGLATEWFADGTMVASGDTWTLTQEHEGKAIRAGSALGPTSNTIEMWVPTDFGTDLYNWWDVTDSTKRTVTDGLVQTVTDKGAVPNNLSPTAVARRPTFSATAFGGRGGAVMDGTDDQLAAVGGTALAQPFTAVLPFLTGSAQNDYAMILDGAFNDSGTRAIAFTKHLDTASRPRIFAGNGANGAGDLGSPLLGASENHLFLVGFSGASSFQRRNGADRVAVLDPGATGLTVRPSIGGRTSGIAFRGTTPGGLIVRRLLTDADARQIEGYYAHTLSIAAVLPASHPHKSAGPRVQ